MNVLLDTNILTRLVEPGHRQHQPALDATNHLGQQGHGLFVVPQVLYEWWVVCTRPTSVNGLGRTAVEAWTELATIRKMFGFLDDPPGLFAEWQSIVSTANVLGKKAHDARLVAAMRVHGLTHLLTFNDQDFTRFAAITVLSPAAVLAPPVPPPAP